MMSCSLSKSGLSPSGPALTIAKHKTDRASLDKLAVEVFDILWEKVTAWLEGRHSLEPFSKQQPPGRVLPTGPANGEPSQIFGTIEDISPDPQSFLHTITDSAVTSSTVASSRLQEPTILPFDSGKKITMNGRPHSGEISSGVGEPIDVHNTFEPILPVQDLESICEQASISMASTNVHDMIQPILPPQAFASSNGLSHGCHPAHPVQAYDPIHGQASTDMANTDVHDMIQPILPPQAFASSNGLSHGFHPPHPVQAYDPIHGQASIDMANTDVHDMIQPILPPQAFASSNGLSHGFHPPHPVQAYDPIQGQASIDMANTDVHDMIQPIHSPQVFIASNNQDAQRNDLEMDKLHHMFSCVQATDPMESQAPTRNRIIEPTRADTQSIYVHDRPHSPFTPVFAM
ncbi:unnamed protein product [Penicillium viridicatum]